ncbi:MAG TPA: DNA internalization-related competence protein ComEC/Rec2 [Gemmatimonadaceae bacterium]
MPLLVYALGSYVVGLYAGFADAFGLLVLATLAAYVVAHRRGPAVRAAFSALCIAGYFVARGTTKDESRCVTRALQSTSVALVIDDSVSPGGFTRAHLDGCDATAALSVERGDARAGSTVLAIGELGRTQRGLLVHNASIRELRRPSILTRVRAHAAREIDDLFHDDAPLVRALLIADRSQLSPAIRDEFAAAGLAHILAIAGLHIGIIALAFSLGLELAGVHKRRASILTIVVIIFYVATIGAPVPAVRSAAMMTCYLATRLVQRPTSRWAIVALGASQPVFDPIVALDVGYQLSVVGVASMIAASLLGKRIGVDRLSLVPRMFAMTLLGATVATIGSAPIVAWVFGRVSLVAPLTNLAATPLIELAQPMIFVALLAAPLHPIASLIADASHPLLVGLQVVAQHAAALPFASPPVAPTVVAAAIAGVMSGATIVACASRDWHRPTTTALSAAAVLVWMPVASLGAGMVELHMIDVGQGDAIALRTPHGHWLLVDAGRIWATGDAGKSTIVPYIGRRGGVLDMFVLTHPHSDHVGGAASVFRALHPKTFVDGGFPGPAGPYRAALQTARDAHVVWVRAHPGDSTQLDGVTVRFLAPDSAWTAHLVDPNLASVVTLVQVGDVRMLLMGDAERPEEEWLLQHEASELHADILKVGHHGSQTSSSEPFLDAVRPRLALVSVGEKNIYHLPTPAIMQRLSARRAQVLRTDHLGSIVVRTDGRRILVSAAGDEWELPGESHPLSER